jgi:hypothetical protein
MTVRAKETGSDATTPEPENIDLLKPRSIPGKKNHDGQNCTA